jgi:hypothetical protein
MHRRRWLIVGVCFCIFSGCVACQSNYDYCGPMPDEGGDFMYRKNSILGGDPSMPLADDEAASDEQDGSAEESGPEPTPAPPPDDQPQPGMDMDDAGLELEPTADSVSESDDSISPQAAEDEMESDEETVSTLQWHAPVKGGPSSVKQVRFRGE